MFDDERAGFMARCRRSLSYWRHEPRESLSGRFSGPAVRLLLFQLSIGLGLVGMVISDAVGWNPRGLGWRDVWALPLGLALLSGVAVYVARPLRDSVRSQKGKH